MSLRREDFPATSIGRTAGNRLQPNNLEPKTESSALTEHGSITTAAYLNSRSKQQRYIPYTPRQRVPSSTATSTSITSPTSSPQQQPGADVAAATKLQLLHLEAAAQLIGLDSGTLGWAILERLALDADSGEDWTEIWSAVTSGKATLLLPLEAAATNQEITPDFLRDHIVLCDTASRKNVPIITLSGIRGTLEEETLTFRSTINTSSKLFHELLIPSMRTARLSSIPPLPYPFPDLPPVSYPQYQVSANTSPLHFPPRIQGTKPPLPPRPNSRVHPPISGPRISNPFASLFGGTKPAPQTPPPPSPPTSLRSFDSQNDSSTPWEISSFVIDRQVVRSDIAEEINNALESELKAALTSTISHPPPVWVLEQVNGFTKNLYPFVNTGRTGVIPIKLDPNNAPVNATPQRHIVNSIDENLEDISEHLQEFFISLEQDLGLIGGPPKLEVIERGSKHSGGEGDESYSEADIRNVMDIVERSITWLFYDRLFSQSTTDDASHDEALSNRISALNQLDLGLNHLGIDIGDVNEGDLNAVVGACGDLLSQLDSCQCPADKASLLVAAHKVIVDGLARLPPIRLISEVDTKSPEADVPVTEEIAESLIENSTRDSETQATVSDTQTSSSPVNESSKSSAVGETRVKSVPPPLDLDTPNLQMSRPLKEPTPVSGDILFPLIIFSVVKANPPHLVSHLLFTQRFRNQAIGGEESYCLINMMAVAEFLENVDMAALGLDYSDKGLSTADLTPILSSRTPVTPQTPAHRHAVAVFRGRVEQQVDAIAGSANRAISGVVDTSFGILRSFMPATNNNNNNNNPTQRTPTGLSSGGRRIPGGPGFGLLKRDSGSLIAGLTAISGKSRLVASGSGEEVGQQMMSVSRAGLKTSTKVLVSGYGVESEDDDEGGSGSSELEEEAERPGWGDTKKIQSFESMLKDSREVEKGSTTSRKTLSDRLASVSELATSNKKSSLSAGFLRPRSRSTTSYVSSRSNSPSVVVPPTTSNLEAGGGGDALQYPKTGIPPLRERFMECRVDDLKLSEVAELLEEYQRLAEAVRAIGLV